MMAMFVTAIKLVAEPTDAHDALKRAAWFAVSSGNSELLLALLKAGLQIDEPIDFDESDTAPQWTALHYSVVHEQPRIARVLVDNRAFLDVRDRFRLRPIDIAYENKQTQICKILSKGTQKESLLAGCPLGVWEEYFFKIEDSKSTNLVFVSVNGEDPPSELSERLRRLWPNVRPVSNATVLSLEEYEAKRPPSAVQDKATGTYGNLINIILAKKSETEYEWGFKRYSGPLDANCSWGTMVRKYGYWIMVHTGGGVS